MSVPMKTETHAFPAFRSRHDDSGDKSVCSFVRIARWVGEGVSDNPVK